MMHLLPAVRIYPQLRKYEKIMEKKMSTPIEAHTGPELIDTLFALQLSLSRSCASTSLVNLQLASRFLLQSSFRPGCLGCHCRMTSKATYLNYCRSLRFEDRPDYAYLRRLLKDLFFREGYQQLDADSPRFSPIQPIYRVSSVLRNMRISRYDFVFDWTILHLSLEHPCLEAKVSRARSCSAEKLQAPSRNYQSKESTSSRRREAFAEFAGARSVGERQRVVCKPHSSAPRVHELSA